MEEGFSAAVHIRYKLRYILQIAFCGNGLLKVVGGASLHTVLVGSVGNYTLFLRRRYMAGVDMECYTLFFTKIAEDSLFVCRGGIFP